MKELPTYTIPAVLSFLDAKDICRCACVAKDWAACLQLDPIASKVQPIRAREQVMMWPLEFLNWINVHCDDNELIILRDERVDEQFCLLLSQRFVIAVLGKEIGGGGFPDKADTLPILNPKP